MDTHELNGSEGQAVADRDILMGMSLLRFAHRCQLDGSSLNELFADPLYGPVAQSVQDCGDPRRRAIQPRLWVRAYRNRTDIDVARIARALDAARPLVASQPDEPTSTKDDEARFDLEVIGAGEFMRKDYRPRWAVEKLLVLDQIGVIAAPKKNLKTTLALDLIISMNTATDFLGHPDFAVPEVLRTLFLSGESGGFTLQETMRRICLSKGIEDSAELEGLFFIGFRLPQLGIPEHIAAVTETIRRHSIRLVVVDPLYLCLLGSSVDPANIFDMGPLYLAFARACLDAGATPVLIHHFKQTGVVVGERPELENVSYAGIQEIARQWLLVNRRRRFEPGSGKHELWLSAGGSVGHSGEWAVDVDEGVIGADFTGRTWDVKVTPAYEVTDVSSKAEVVKKALSRQDDKNRERDAHAQTALSWLRAYSKGEATTTVWKAGVNFGTDKMSSVIAHLEESGLIEKVQISISAGKGTRFADGWAPVAEPGTIPYLRGLPS